MQIMLSEINDMETEGESCEFEDSWVCKWFTTICLRILDIKFKAVIVLYII